MIFRWEIFRSVADIWVVWLIGATLFGALILRAGRSGRWRTLGGFLADEGGASYALPYVLTCPAYVLIVCVMIQATMILMVKMDSMYAAYAAARSAVVWRSAAPGTTDDSQLQFATDRARRAAALAMTPMASAFTDHYKAIALSRPGAALGRLAETAELAPHYYAVYAKMVPQDVSRDRSDEPPPAIIPSDQADQSASLGYTSRKLGYAMMATDVELTMDQNQFNADLTATVNYVMPMHIPGAGRILGNWWAPNLYYARTITSAATLPLETPLSDNKQLGIPYVPKTN